MRLRHTAAVALAAALLLPTAPTAQAEPALAAPGAPFNVSPVNPPTTLEFPWGDEIKVPPVLFYGICSQGPVGTVQLPDGRTQRVMLTASHCVTTLPGMQPVSREALVPVGTGHTRIGVRDRANSIPASALDLSDPVASIRTADWGVVLIDDSVTDTRIAQSRKDTGGPMSPPVRLTKVRDYPTLPHGQVAVDNFGQPICKDGTTSGRSCGTQIGRTRNGVYSWNLNYKHGDSGGINYDPRTGEIIGVSSMALGPLGKAQPADRIIEDAYGVPDGHVNEVFTVTESTAPRAEFRPVEEDGKAIDAYIAEHNPDFTMPDPRAELRGAVADAQRDAQRLADQALRGNYNPAEVEKVAEQHVDQIGLWGSVIIAEEAQRILGEL